MERTTILTKEIDLIQACITRMSQNSFMIKGWLITLYAAILVLIPLRFNYRIPSIIAALTVLCFWYLDGSFLKFETLFRWKYNWVIKNRLVTSQFLFDLNPHNKHMWIMDDGNCPEDSPCVLSKMLSRTLLPLYLPLLVVALLLFINSFTEWIAPL